MALCELDAGYKAMRSWLADRGTSARHLVCQVDLEQPTCFVRFIPSSVQQKRLWPCITASSASSFSSPSPLPAFSTMGLDLEALLRDQAALIL